MAPILNHTIVRANEKWASAEFSRGSWGWKSSGIRRLISRQ